MNLEEELVVGDPNDYFDELASKRWRRKGDSHGLLLCCRPRMGGLPDAADCAMLEQNQVKLIVSCFQDFCTQRGGSIPRGAFQIKFNYTAQMLRGKHWDPGALKAIIKPTLAQGHGIFVHCSAGCHRAPVAAAMLIPCLQGKSFDDSIAHIQKLRNIEPWKIVGPLCDRDLVDWVHSVANGRTLPDSILRVPAELVCGFRRLPFAYGSFCYVG